MSNSWLALRRSSAALLLVLGACASPTAPDGAPQLVGEVIDLGSPLLGHAQGHLQIHVKDSPSEECGIIFTVDDDTWLGNSGRRLGNNDGADVLERGDHVEVWFDLVEQSCPAQSRAQAVNRISSP